MQLIRKDSLILILIFLLFFLLLTPLGVFNDWIPPSLHTSYYAITAIDMGDDAGYYAYLRSAFFDGDFDFINEQNYAHSEKITATGYVFNNWQVGQSILFFPFFLAGHLGALLLNALHYPVPLDGYSFPYLMSTAIASQTYLFLGLLVLYQTLKDYFEDRIALIATILIWLAGPLLYYSFIRQRMSHTLEFCFAVIFLRFWLKNRLSQDLVKHAVLGGVVGLLCTIRVINVAILGPYFIDQAQQMASKKSPFAEQGGKSFLSRSLYFMGGWFLTFMPQLMTWYRFDGIPLPAFHLGLAGNEVSSFSLDAILDHTYKFFLGSGWGLLYSSPPAFIGLIGLTINHKSLPGIRLVLLVGVTLYIIEVILLFSHLAAYEYRYLSPALPFFAIGLATVLQKCSQSAVYWRTAMIAAITCVCAQYMMILQYSITLRYNDPQFTLKALGAIPSIILNKPDLLLYSTDWLKLILLERNHWSVDDFLFLLVFPALQLMTIALLFMVGSGVSRLMEHRPSLFKSGRLLSGMFLVSVTLTILIVFLTPAKSQQQIENRKKFVSLINDADSFLAAKKYGEAINLFSMASSLEPSSTAPIYQAGVVLSAQLEYMEANKYFNKVLEIYPNHAASLTYLGNNFRVMNKLSEAEFYLKSALRANPNIRMARLALAEVYRENKKGDSLLSKIN